MIQGSDPYTVDFTATTGLENRWMSQMGKPVPTVTGETRIEKLLTYTSAPLGRRPRIDGKPDRDAPCRFHA